MKPKKSINAIIIALIAVSLFSCAVFIIPIVLFILYPYPKSLIKNYYYSMLQAEDSAYETLYISIEEIQYHPDYKGRVFSITPKVDEELYNQMYGGDDKSFKEEYPFYYNKFGLEICKENNVILNNNNFFEEISENIVITVITYPSTMAIDTGYPLLSVQIGDKVYLDFETGKNNWLEYIRRCINNPRLYGNE